MDVTNDYDDCIMLCVHLLFSSIHSKIVKCSASLYCQLPTHPYPDSKTHTSHIFLKVFYSHMEKNPSYFIEKRKRMFREILRNCSPHGLEVWPLLASRGTELSKMEMGSPSKAKGRLSYSFGKRGRVFLQNEGKQACFFSNTIKT